MAQTQPLVKYQSSGGSWLRLLWPYEEENVCKTLDVFILSHSSVKRIKDARYSTGKVPKNVNASDLTMMNAITCSNTVSL